MRGKDDDMVCTAYEAITVSNTAKSLTSTNIQPTSGAYAGMVARKVEISVETDDIRYTLDSTTPTDSIGALVDVSFVTHHPQIVIYGGQNIKNAQFIRVTTDASIKVHYFH